MKIKIDRATIGHLITVCTWRKQCNFSNVLAKKMCDDELNQLQKKCTAKLHQKQATIEVSNTQAVAISMVIQANTNHPLSLVIFEYIINPVVKNIQK